MTHRAVGPRDGRVEMTVEPTDLPISRGSHAGPFSERATRTHRTDPSGNSRPPPLVPLRRNDTLESAEPISRPKVGRGVEVV
jgi:hypothetical protein